MGRLIPTRSRFTRALLMLVTFGLPPATWPTDAASEPLAAPDSEAAAILEVGLRTLQRKLKEYREAGTSEI